MLNNKDRFSKYSSFIIAAITELFIFSYAGECLKREVISTFIQSFVDL
jgi:hypothetical protein